MSRRARDDLVVSPRCMGVGGLVNRGAICGTITSYLQGKINRNPRLRFLHGKAETTLMVGAAAGIAAIFRASLTGCGACSGDSAGRTFDCERAVKRQVFTLGLSVSFRRVHAAVNLSYIGYTRDASKISYDHQEIAVDTAKAFALKACSRQHCGL